MSDELEFAFAPLAERCVDRLDVLPIALGFGRWSARRPTPSISPRASSSCWLAGMVVVTVLVCRRR